MNYSDYLNKTKEYGVAEQIKYPIVFLSGLPGVRPNEMVIFETGQVGRVIALEKQLVQVMLFDSNPVRMGTKATRTLEKLNISVGLELLGRVIDPLGNDLFSGLKKFKSDHARQVDLDPLGVPSRSRITAPFLTGSALVDTLIPLGKGQRELVVGDRKTGKTSFVLTSIKTQIQQGAIVVYAAIGKRKTEIKKLNSFFESEKLSKNIVIVASSSQDSPSMVYLTPYCAMTIAEYFCMEGNDVLVVFDDLTTHAKFYREIALLGRKFPGRESYPGDMFYTHAKLLERAGNFKHPEKKEVSITALPIAETMEGDLKGYIVSNLISITDGHILFSNSILNSGRRPAIDIFLSVTRVGKQTRKSLERDLSTQITAFLSRYERLENVSHFGSELSAQTNKILESGRKILAIFDQSYRSVIPPCVQQILMMMIWAGLEGQKSIKEVQEYRDQLAALYHKDVKLKQIMEEIVASHTLEQGIEKLKQQLAKFKVT